ncbi:MULTISPECIES: site-specific DNA-methyltransferase [unclassified Oscillibacter]|uniref:site-specific DNA-methyltransferase n=1 Tax=unclassified Oscillibacter TaxID=2629304 RepID=UPI0003FCDB12|nr:MULTISPECIES: site-specific DNA-methyltransferase [unclassified Oscillibacter]
MNHMKFETPDLTAQNIEKLAALFPGCVTEGPDGHGGLKKAVNFDLLKQLLSDAVLEGDEAYEFTWVGKKAAIVEANKPIRKTLRPCPEESKNWDTTENLYIEGDNLEVLKLLQEAYLGKVKMIYIDPPYNTGHDFIYNDRFEMDKQEYDQQIGLFDEEGNKNFVENSESNPRFHSDWCSMMYPRLMLARNMLSDDGVIFISIDDVEVNDLRKIADEIFGASNFVASIIWEKKYAPANDAKWLSDNHDYILLYAKNKSLWHPQLLPRSDEMNSRYTNRDNDSRGPWKAADMTVKSYSAAYDYPITTPSGRIVKPAQGRCWNTSKENFEKLVLDNRIWFGDNGDNVPAVKKFLTEVQEGVVPMTIWKYSDVGHSQEGRQEVKKLFDNNGFFDGPKPVRLLDRMLTIANLGTDSIVLDFFSGSATTAHAVMQLNAKDGGHRKFIMVQLPEPCDEKSEAYKAGYKNICEIGKERIRRSGEKIKEKNFLITQNLDIGFRVLKLDSTNMEDVYYSAQEYSQQMLQNMASNIKSDRTDLDLLFGCLLDWGLPLSMPHHSEQMEGCTIHTYNEDDLIACFDENVPESVIREIARRKPLRAVFRDSSFATSPEKINVGEIFKLLAPETRVKVI